MWEKVVKGAKNSTGYRYCFGRESFGNSSRKIYHRYVAERKGPKCKATISDAKFVGMAAVPQNRVPCQRCFGKRKG